MTGALRIAIVLAAAAAATIVANVVLLGVATGRQDPVGRLAPPAASAPAATSPIRPPGPLPGAAGARHPDEPGGRDD